MFNINWNQMIMDLLGDAKTRQPKRINTLKSWFKSLKTLYDMLVVFFNDLYLKATHQGHVDVLKKLLNDRYDMTLRRIFIDSDLIPDRFFIYLKAEAEPPVYVYNKWNAAHAFVVGERCAYNNRIWLCLTNNTNVLPGSNPALWQNEKPIRYIRQKGNFANINSFIIYVPTGLAFNEAEMRAFLIDFVVAGRQYTIQTF